MGAGLSVEQAGALAELFAGQWSLLPGRRRANACDLIKFVKRYSADTALWEQLCVVSDPAGGSGRTDGKIPSAYWIC